MQEATWYTNGLMIQMSVTHNQVDFVFLLCASRLPAGVEHAAVASTRHQDRGGRGWGTGSGDD